MMGRLDEALAGCREALDEGLETAPLLAACGQAQAEADDWAQAYDFFEGAALRVPEDGGLSRLKAQAAPRAAAAWLEKAKAAEEAGDSAESRQAAERSLAIDGDDLEALRLAGEAALDDEDFDVAYRRLLQAWKKAPEDRQLGAEAGEAALRTEHYETASVIFRELAEGDPSYRDRAREAEEEFLISNWPAADRSIAHAARLTRAQAALLLWRLVPQVRWARSATPAPVASDIVARKDRRILSRCLQLGLLSVDAATHRARPDVAMRPEEAQRMIARAAVLAGAGKTRSERPLPTKKGGWVSGRELRRALRAAVPEEGQR